MKIFQRLVVSVVFLSTCLSCKLSDNFTLNYEDLLSGDTVAESLKTRLPSFDLGDNLLLTTSSDWPNEVETFYPPSKALCVGDSKATSSLGVFDYFEKENYHWSLYTQISNDQITVLRGTSTIPGMMTNVQSSKINTGAFKCQRFVAAGYLDADGLKTRLYCQQKDYLVYYETDSKSTFPQKSLLNSKNLKQVRLTSARTFGRSKLTISYLYFEAVDKSIQSLDNSRVVFLKPSETILDLSNFVQRLDYFEVNLELRVDRFLVYIVGVEKKSKNDQSVFVCIFDSQKFKILGCKLVSSLEGKFAGFGLPSIVNSSAILIVEQHDGVYTQKEFEINIKFEDKDHFRISIGDERNYGKFEPLEILAVRDAIVSQSTEAGLKLEGKFNSLSSSTILYAVRSREEGSFYIYDREISQIFRSVMGFFVGFDYKSRCYKIYNQGASI